MARRNRSRLAPDEARRRYVRAAESVLLRQIQADARRLDAEDDGRSVAVGPFAKLSAEEVADSTDGKSRGAITNLFKSQRQFQLSAMALVLDDPEVDVAMPPDPAGFETADAWLDALATEEADRGPHHGMEPVPGYGLIWALWLSQVPYGVWSQRIAAPSMREIAHSADRLEVHAILPALERFSLRIRSPWTALDLATAMASLVEGVWLNQALTNAHPTRQDRSDVDAMRTAVRMVWEGATEPATSAGRGAEDRR
jgi:hypothetical protein